MAGAYRAYRGERERESVLNEHREEIIPHGLIDNPQILLK
jgi:hypothetical protein